MSDLHEAFDDPETLPESVDEAAVRRMRAVAYVLDDSVPVPGTDRTVGLDPILGAVPVVGDAVSGAISLYIVLEAARLGVSYGTLLRLIANVAVDVAGGAVPVVGDLFDAVWKANRRNLRLVLADLTDDETAAVEIEVE